MSGVVGSGGIGLRAQLDAVGSVLGVPLIVTDDAEWGIDLDGLRVGLGWYAARGHSEAESVALALLQVWEGCAPRVRHPSGRGAGGRSGGRCQRPSRCSRPCCACSAPPNC
ncbi:hypothetical protein [Leucobacter soli]|uniref:hypothetical protein n=1 Tax=Leucobacter soli TaxID=2812850 RepID=UPI003616DCDE